MGTQPPAARPPTAAPRLRRRQGRTTSLFAHGEPMVWLTGGALVLSLLMIAGLLATVVGYGASTFWPGPVHRVETPAGAFLGEPSKVDRYRPGEAVLADASPEVAGRMRAEMAAGDGTLGRLLLRTGNFDLTGTHFRWIDDAAVESDTQPPEATVIERLSWGRFYGTPAAFVLDGETTTTDPRAVWTALQRWHDESRDRYARRRDLETNAVGAVNRRLEQARLELRRAELEHGEDSPERAEAQEDLVDEQAVADADFVRIREQIDALDAQNDRYHVVFDTVDGQQKDFTLAEIVRAYQPNQLGLFGKLGVYASRWWEFLTAEPRYANMEGGVFPAIFGTVAMTLIMSLMVVPFGVLAALYLREYARQGRIVSAVRIAVNNLAGVPSIVFGVFGLGFFCYVIGGQIDALFYPERLPNPTFGKDGLLWAAFTLALLTLPVVIVATEEALAAVPNSMREGSYACGATKWQTIRRIVLPRAAPGIMTGMILAIARGAGEVAPLMLVGAVKFVPDLPIDVHDWSGSLGPLPTGPLHLERSFMHLGFHIYDLGFQSPNSEAAKPMVFTTTLLLIGIIVILNALAIWVRARLRARFQGARA